MRSACSVCLRDTNGIGHYEFCVYGLKYHLCGRHAKMVKDFIEDLRKKEKREGEK